MSTDPAFPHLYHLDGEDYPTIEEGLTKREYFAALALQGLLASQSPDYYHAPHRQIAQAAVEYADMLADAPVVFVGDRDDAIAALWAARHQAYLG